MLKSSATSSRASMLAAVSGLCRERKSETSILANPSDEGGLVAVLLTIVERVWAEEEEVEEEERAPSLTSPTFEEDSGRQHEDDELAGWCGGSGGCDSGGGGGSDACGSAGTETMEEALFELLSLAESLQAQLHWQDSSCLMMMTGRLRPICWTELPEDRNTISSYLKTIRTKQSGWVIANLYHWLSKVICNVCQN